MLENDQKYVALFIDWDNLAISTAADFGGASPDLRRIVQKAQQYGTVLLAKAYAEWTATSDKLNVYRAGVEPVYAPTFRFETEAITRGKSLADPCMVADIVDSLHLFSMLSTLILVTGDKDLIPVVRLAQLRGKKVVVIGPDFVAGVLRDMADDFVSYRKLIDSESSKPGPEPGRRHAPAALAATAPTVVEHEPVANSRTSVVRSTGATPSTEAASSRGTSRRGRTDQRPREGERASAATRKSTAPETALAVEAATELLTARTPINGRDSQPAAEKPSAPELPIVFEAVVELLRQRAEEGKPRVRATNLKDALMQKIGGFSERRYGFSKFKDLLTAAEANGLVNVRVAGPVHWVSLPDPADSSADQAVAPVEVAPTEAKDADNSEPQMEEMVQFIQNLRERSRWLTYTYLLTNMISHFARSLPQSNAEARARTTLNWLVQEGVLRIDKEPQEVDVAGAKHRVRMCHLEDGHPQVAAILEAMSSDSAEPRDTVLEPTSLPAETALEVLIVEEPIAESETAESPVLDEEAVTARPITAEGAADLVVDRTPSSEVEVDVTTDAEGALESSTPVVETVDSSDVPESAEEAITAWQSAPLVKAESRPATWLRPATDSQPVIEATPSAGVFQEAELAEIEPIVMPRVTENGHDEDDHSRQQVFALLATLVRENTGPKRPRMGAAGLKTRLVKTLGSFDERSYGFTRFKEFLMAAETQGYVRLDTSGQITWVLPAVQD